MVLTFRRADREDSARRLFGLALLVLCMVVGLSAGLAQTGRRADPECKTPAVCTVEGLLRLPSGFSTGFSEKQSDRLGDQVGIALQKIFNEKELVDPENIRKYLPIIRSSFSYPQLVAA